MKSRFSVFLVFVFGAVAAFSGVYVYELFFSFKEDIGKLNKEYRLLQDNHNLLDKKYKKSEEENILAEAENKNIRDDRDRLKKDNLMLEEKNKKMDYELIDAKNIMKRLKEGNKRLVSDVNERIKNILKDRESLPDKIENLKFQVADYRQRLTIQENLPDNVLDLKSKYVSLQLKKNRIENRNRECLTKLAALTEKANRLEIENNTYKDTISRSNSSIDVLSRERDGFKSEDKKASADLDIAKKTIIELNSQNKKLTRENKAFKNRVSRVPQSMTELAQLKKQLKKEKTLFYYNMGVFYTQKGDYKKAVKSFNKVVAMNSQDTDAHYNLGIIYSEYLNDTKKAIEHFKVYLNLAPNDPDSDKARKYLLLQESVEGHK